jgi:hypothetical protein
MYDTICGTGRPCERTCPVMRIGRICPDVPTYLEEVRAILAAETVTELEGSPQLAPQLA